MNEPIQENVSLNDRPHHLNPEQMPANSESCQSNGASPAHHTNAENFEPPPASQSGPNMGRSLGQIFIILVVLLVLVNIPFNSYSTGLAQLMPQSTAIVIREGLLFKGSGPETYVVDNYKLRQVSPEAMNEFFGHYRKINTVEDSLLQQFGQGPPVHWLLQCRTKPDVYAVEDGHKRRIIAPLPNGVNSWDKVNFVSCSYLERLPDGPPIRGFVER